MFSRLSSRVARQSVRSFSSLRAASTGSTGRLAVATVATTAAAAYLLSTAAQSNTVHAAPQYSQPGSKLPPEGIVGSNYERTFIAIKPDGVQRGLIAKIIARFEEKGFQLVAMKLITPTEEIARGHYDDLKNKPFFPSLTRFFASGPIIAMVWQGKGAIATGRRLLGETDPAKSLPGSIRGDYSIDIGRNIIHGSDGPEGAQHEINFWFTPAEIHDWQPSANQHIYEKP